MEGDLEAEVEEILRNKGGLKISITEEREDEEGFMGIIEAEASSGETPEEGFEE